MLQNDLLWREIKSRVPEGLGDTPKDVPNAVK
jgi:hypothetical protein